MIDDNTLLQELIDLINEQPPPMISLDRMLKLVVPGYVPLSVRSSRRKRFVWRLRYWREWLAFRIAPWLKT